MEEEGWTEGEEVEEEQKKMNETQLHEPMSD